MNTTTRNIALGGFGAAITASTLLLAPHANADTGDANFLRQLRDHSIVSPEGSSGLITVGHAVCNELDAMPTSYVSLNKVAGFVQTNNPRMTTDDAQWFVAIAAVNYCAWNIPADSGTTPAPATPVLHYAV